MTGRNLAHFAVHTPLSGQGDPKFLGKYQAAIRPDPGDDYAALVASVDASLGSILDHLDSLGIANNTIAILLSDNGGLSNHTRDSGGPRKVQTSRGNWKLIHFYGDGESDGNGLDPRYELYDLAADIGETTNVAESHPQVVADLGAGLRSYLLEVNAPLAEVRTTGQKAELRGEKVQRLRQSVPPPKDGDTQEGRAVSTVFLRSNCAPFQHFNKVTCK